MADIFEFWSRIRRGENVHPADGETFARINAKKHGFRLEALLVRVGADSSIGGGGWNGPVDAHTGKFVYVAIPETKPVCAGMEKPYSGLDTVLALFGVILPARLRMQHMHLDPDFDHLTYGDQGERARQLRTKLKSGDMIVFYSGLLNARSRSALVYAIVGLFIVDEITQAADIPIMYRHINAHSRRMLVPGAEDLVVRARRGVSGRLERCFPIGEWRDRAYRVRRDLLEVWGGISVKDGYLQRSARLPEFVNPSRFLTWFTSMNPILIQANNLTS